MYTVQLDKKNSNEIIISFNYNPKLIQLTKELPSRRYDPDTRSWIASSPLGVSNLVNTLKEKYSEYNIQLSEELKGELILEASMGLKSNEYIQNYPFLKDYQKEAIKNIIEKRRYAVFDEPGLGKTVESIVAADIFLKNTEINKVIIICPASIKNQWQEEIQNFLKHESSIIQTNKRQKIFDTTTKWKITNYETFTKFNAKELKQLAENTILIIDEASKIKNPKAKRTKAIKILATQSSSLILLTGTPIENRLEDAYNLISTIAPFMNYKQFETQHCIKEQIDLYDKSIYVTVGYKNLNKFKETIKPYCIRRLKQDVIKELPEKIINTRIISLSKDQKYFITKTKERIKQLKNISNKIMNDPFYAALSSVFNGKEPQPNDIYSRLLATFTLMHMASNSLQLIEDSDSETLKLLDIPLPSPEIKSKKITELTDIFNEKEDTHTLIFTKYAKMAHIIAEARKCPCITGENSSEEKTQILADFKDGKFKTLVATDCIAYGISLPFVHTIINFDIPWNPSILDQRNNRAHRINTPHPVNIINLISEGPELEVYNLIKSKQNLFDSAVGKRADVLGQLIEKW